MEVIVFTLGETYYGITTDETEEIAKTISSIPVPESDAWVQGIINIRGQVLTLVNFDNLLNPNKKGPEVCYNHTIIGRLDTSRIALMVEDIIGIIEVDPDELQPIMGTEHEAVTGLFPAFDQIVSVVELNKLFSENEG